MNLPVTLAGHTLPWRFRDSHALDAWLSTAPWTRTGGARVVRIPTPELSFEFGASIRRAVRGHDDGGTTLRFLVIDPRPGVRRGVSDGLGLPADLSRHGFHRAVADVARDNAIIILVSAEREIPGDLWTDAQALVDVVSKLQQGASITMIVFDHPGTHVAADAYDFCAGFPAEGLLAYLGDSEPSLWRRYVHGRLAWETGGDLSRALAWNEHLPEAMPVGGDDHLEQFLNEGALEDLRGVSVDEQAALLGAVANPSSRAPASLYSRGLLRSTASGVSRPVPWVARAFLLERRARSVVSLLRSCLVASPLAHEILERCFDLEAMVRLALLPVLSAEQPPDDLVSRFRALQERRRGSDADFYPAGCPALPESAWSLASLGQLIYSAPSDPRLDADRQALRDLRNLVAHGHYVSWRMITTLRRISRRLGSG